jgi:hypothetical protein
MTEGKSVRPIPVMAFVDWNTQVHAAKRHKSDMPMAEHVLVHVAKRLIEGLSDYLPDYRFEVRLRLYCGWHKGFEPTQRRKELAKISDEDLFQLSTHRNITIRSLAFGDTALGALQKRVVRGTNSHFPATCRDHGHNGLEEKMVDTALISDLIYCAARDDDGAWLAIIGEDIDLMPGVYTAEGFLAMSSRKIAYLRKTSERYLECKDLQLFFREKHL